MLGVVRTSSEQEIKSAYRKLAMQYHPDRNPDSPAAEEKFKEVTEAYTVLIDGEKRSMYDQFGHSGVNNVAQGFDPTVFQDFTDIFGEFFGFGDIFGGGGRRRSRAQRGADLREDLTLEFDEAVFGTEKRVNVRRHEACEDCHGAGTAPAKRPFNARRVRAAARSAISRDFSALLERAQPVRVRAASSLIHARVAKARRE